MSKKQITKSFDLLGICASFICAIHCLAVPFLLILGLESILKVVDNEWVEVSILLSSLFIGLIAFLSGLVKHRQHFIPVLFVAGFLLIVNGEAVESEWLSVTLAVTGAAIISYAHFQNLKWRRHAVNA